MLTPPLQRVLLAIFAAALGGSAGVRAENGPDFAPVEEEFTHTVLPLLDRFCLDCHDRIASEGELDLERFDNFAAVRADPETWQHVAEQLENGEMPPKKEEKTAQPSEQERATLVDWVRRYLGEEARAQAGDPGPVVLRRLSNAEYTYTVRDLTGVPTLDPAREFPVDSAAGEGFTNAGGALVMSPALFEKYLQAGKEIAAHAVLLPDGFRFSPSTTRADHAHEVLDRIREMYLRTTGGTAIDFSYTSQVRSAAPEGTGEGRLDLAPYFAALLTHHDELIGDPNAAREIANEAGLNAKYLTILARSLLAESADPSLLLDWLRREVKTAEHDQAAALAAEVRRWQDQLWSFNKVGHFGLIRNWQQPISPLVTARDIRIAVTADTREIRLQSRSLGGDEATVLWQQPRFERTGRPPILLRDLQTLAGQLERIRNETLASTASYLSAAAEFRDRESETVAAVAKQHTIDPALLEAWLSYLGLPHRGAAEIEGHLTHRLSNGGGYDFVRGWGLDGVADYSFVANASDQDVRIPGELRAHHIAVHPRPERWIAAGWQSPINGTVRIDPAVRDAHSACGNGIRWTLELRRGNLTRVLQSGDLDLGQKAVIQPIDALPIEKGDFVSLIIGARDGNHSCDLTEIDLTITEADAPQRAWSLTGDCADSIHAGNPHADSHGHLAVWHFFGGSNENRPSNTGPPPGSLLAQWITTSDPHRKAAIAEQTRDLLTSPSDPNRSEADRELRSQLQSLNGPLFSRFDFAQLAAASGEVPSGFESSGDLTAPTSADLTFEIPPSLLAGSEFVTRGVVPPDSSAAVQMIASPSRGAALSRPDPSQPIVVSADAPARENLERALADFRNLFPAAMCYARVVPADEVVTLLLYHREDEHLARLMLEDAEKRELDALWDELRFVSREPLRLVTAYEQLWQFATQDSDPTQFEPMEPTIRKRAARFEKSLTAAETRHLNALIDFAPKLYRRPLRDGESTPLRVLYQRLRDENLPHGDAFRLTLARLFTSAPFLYKLEEPAPGPDQAPVSGWELATRLSYFLTSSAPDRALTAAAASGTLTNPNVLLDHTRRLLKHDRARRLAIEFACQWLHIRDFGRFDEKNERLYPEFATLRTSMSEEAIRFFTDFFQNDRSILSLLDADHTFVDAPLARFYQLPGPDDDQWRRVGNIRKAGRGGILGMAATLARQSGASRTSPILRGTWVSETLLGERLPKPPKNVPQLPDEVPEGLSERELILRHSSDPACAKCHRRIDPYGFSLEAYDAIGRNRSGVDTSAKLPDGKQIEGIEGLRQYLLEDRRDTFVRNFCRKLLGYALGRETQLSDDPFLDELMKDLEREHFRIGLAVEAVVLSPQFREIRGSR